MSNFATNGSEPAVFIKRRLVTEVTNNTKYISFFKTLARFAVVYGVCTILVGCGAVSRSKKMLPANIVKNECVILLHGLGRTYHSMDKMQTTLTHAGYHTINFDYPSRKESIEQLASEYIPAAIDQCNELDPVQIHFVTHSLGGIVLRMAVKQKRPKKLGRVVMLSPPNQGSEAVDDLKERWYFSWLNGPAGQELSTSEDSTPNQLGPVDYPVGIIIGDRHAFFDAWLLKLFQGANDGKVSVERAKLDGMTDFIVVHESHSFIMKSELVQSQTIEFLNNGAFLHDNNAGIKEVEQP
jgi:triacylglycerol lipase